MALKLNKKIKQHIVQMAIRQKFETEYNDAFLALTVSLNDLALKECKAHLFNNLDSHVLSCVKKTHRVDLYNSIFFNSRNVRVGLGVKHEYISRINVPNYIYGSEYSFCFRNQGESALTKEFQAYVKKIEEFAGIIESSLDCFKSANKMFKELPWTESLYPESEKKPTCNIVPISTIAIANELMGVK